MSRSPGFPPGFLGGLPRVPWLNVTEIEDLRREASWGEENDEPGCEHVDSKDPWGTQEPRLEVVSVTLKLRPEVRTGNRNRRAINVQAGLQP